MKYQDYLIGQDWKEKKKLKEARRKKRCGICGDNKLVDLHHLNYRNLFDVLQTDLRFLCRRCHFLSHKLHKEGKIKFYKENHHSRFIVIKNAVKKELGISGINMFK